MLRAERERADPIDFVVIATPNHLHLPVRLRRWKRGLR
jgi:predicted dehydrogenase